MKIIAATALRVHGYLDISIKFNDDLTIIVGPNGSGKTTILYLMQLALSLSVDKLARIKFSELVMHIQEDNGNQGIIVYTHSANTISLMVPHLTKVSIPFKSVSDDPFMYSYMKRDLLKNPKYAKIVDYFNNIKKPCFLNVERVESFRDEEDDDDGLYDLWARKKENEISQRKRLKNVSELIASVFKEIADKRVLIQNELYTDIFMSLFTHDYKSYMQNPQLKPDVVKLKSIKSAVNELIIKTFSTRDMERYDDKVNKFFDNPPKPSVQSGANRDQEGLMNLLGYSFQLNRIL